MTEGVLLETERLILRRVREADADHLFDLDNDPEVMRFINGGTPASRLVIENKILPTFMRYDDLPGLGVWTAVAKSSGSFLGWFSFRPTGEDGEIALGYRLRKEVWGQGYATEGVQALIDRGFAEWGIQRIVATTYEENIASRRVMEKAGMTFKCSFHITPEDIANADTYHAESTEVWDGEDVLYVVEKLDWKRHHSNC